MFSKSLSGLVLAISLSLFVGCGSGGNNTGTGGGTGTGGATGTGGSSNTGGGSATGGGTGTGGGQTAGCDVTGTFDCGGAGIASCNLKNEYCDIGDKDWEGSLGFPYICASLPPSTGACKDCAWLLTQKGCFMGGTPTCTGTRQTGFTITCQY